MTGHVTDGATQAGVRGATVAVLSQPSLLTQTNDSGSFRLAVPNGDVTLVVRMFGYKPRQIPVPGTQSLVDVALERDVLNLDKVVVTGQATTVQSANAAIAVSSLDNRELASTSAATMEVSLQGKVVGASINLNSGAPGGGGQVQIRGVTSLIGNAEPLYVVDGVLISNAAISSGTNALEANNGAITSVQDNMSTRLADINQADIENVQVLKGASASAIYGAKATNGVIVITTKRGSAGAPHFELTQVVGESTPYPLTSSRHFLTVADLYAAQPTAKVIIDSLVAANGGKIPWYDYQGQLYSQRSPSVETIADLSGGTNDTKYFASVSNKYDSGIMINTGSRRQSGRLNVDQTLGSRWHVSAGVNLVKTVDQRGLSNNSTDWVGPMYLFSYTPAIINLNSRTPNGLFVRNPFGGGGGSNASNPLETMTYITNEEVVDRQMASLNVRYSAYESDKHTVQFTFASGLDQYSYNSQIYSPGFLQYEPGDGFLGTAAKSNRLSRNTNNALNAIWTLRPGRMFLASATTSGGIVQETQFADEVRVRSRGLTPGLDLVNQGSIDDAEIRTLVKNVAYYAQEEVIAFGDRLYVQGAFRADRSSVDGDPSKYYIFPKGSASYRFKSPFRFTDEVKLRAAVGTSGNQPLYGQKDYLLSSLGVIQGATSIVPNQNVGNSALKPEKMTEQEYGIDASFFDRRAALELTYFSRTITDMLLQAPLVPSSGLGLVTINGGKMTSNGQEVSLTLVPLQTNSLNWTFRTQFYHINQKVISLPVAPFAVANTGFATSFGRSFIKAGYSTTGIWGNMKRPNGTVVDTLIGDATPRYTMQFTNEFTFKAFSLSVLLDWKNGGNVVDITQNRMDEGKNSRDYDNPSPDPKIGATLGAYRYNMWAGGNNAAFLVADGSFVKMREVTLSYTVPKGFIQRIPAAHNLKDVRFELSGRNLITWSKYWGIDPEFSNFGNSNTIRVMDLGGYAPSRSYFLSVHLGY